ncbi:maleylacetate reductase [Terrabacter carboxydivorans]
MTAAGVQVHETTAGRVLLGPGARRCVPSEVDRLRAERAFVVSTRSAAHHVDECLADLGSRAVGRFDGAVVHTPVHVTEEALALVLASRADVIVAFGGGSATGLSKAISARTGLPQVVVPTTYAGSEVTPVLGETRDGAKTTRRDPALLPDTVVYDPELTLSMPRGLTLTSALNALAHAVEATWAVDSSAYTDALATEAVSSITQALPLVLDSPTDLAARGRLHSGAWLAGCCLAQTRMGLHHQLAHALGGSFDLPHAELHALLLPHVTAYNLPAAPAARERLTRAVGDDPVQVLADLAAQHDGARRLRDLDVPRDALRAVAERVAAAPYPNPAPVDVDSVTGLLERAW